MNGRNYNSNSYKYGFNGKENDPETGTQDYGMRIYNPLLGKFLSVDPLQKEFAWNSSYAFAENDVIRSIDLDGKERLFVYYAEDKSGTMLNNYVTWKQVHPESKEDHGPLGSGEWVTTKDKKTGQFTGRYSESYEDLNPIKGAVLNFEARYTGKNGLTNVVHDAPVAGKVVGAGVVVVGAVSTAFGNPAGPALIGGGLEIYNISDRVGNVIQATEGAVDIGVGLYKGDNAQAERGAINIVGAALDEGTGALVPKITGGDKILEATGTISTDVLNTVITDNAANDAKPEED